MEPFVLVMARGVRSRTAASCRLHSAKAALSLVSLLCFFFFSKYCVDQDLGVFEGM